MNTTAYANTVAAELAMSAAGIDEAAAAAFADAVLRAGREGGVFVAGAGRSGLMGRAFAMRLVHLGLTAYVVGETVTPGIGPGGLLVIGSGSGSTASLLAMAARAGELGASVALVTTKPDSPIGASADLLVRLPGAAKDEQGASTIQPMGALFEQGLLLFYDSVVLRLMELQEQDGRQLYGRHANLE
ncbi:6-phospho-3-hexuloisomerase [Paenibacillus humicus]|uniref:6-phospho-3-hexuloisomerase n=1 Tax=Paenibacillus humicus TaxID=412861 RepID=UPI003F162D69